MRYRTLTKNKEFSRIYARGKSYVHPNLVLYVAKNRLGYTRIGLTATKKVGHAVQRNRARRIMRAALSEHLSQNIGGYDIILVARARTPYLKSTQLSKTLAGLMRKAGLPDKKVEGIAGFIIGPHIAGREHHQKSNGHQQQHQHQKRHIHHPPIIDLGMAAGFPDQLFRRHGRSSFWD